MSEKRSCAEDHEAIEYAGDEYDCPLCLVLVETEKLSAAVLIADRCMSGHVSGVNCHGPVISDNDLPRFRNAARIAREVMGLPADPEFRLPADPPMQQQPTERTKLLAMMAATLMPWASDRVLQFLGRDASPEDTSDGAIKVAAYHAGLLLAEIERGEKAGKS